MSITLREKLKLAKKKSELKSIKKLISLETQLQETDITCNNIEYQTIINISYDKLTLIKDCFDMTAEKEVFVSFFTENFTQEKICFMVKKQCNIFFLSLPYFTFENNLAFFWDEDNTLNQSNEKIFITDDLSKGLVILMSEHGIEPGSW